MINFKNLFIFYYFLFFSKEIFSAEGKNLLSFKPGQSATAENNENNAENNANFKNNLIDSSEENKNNEVLIKFKKKLNPLCDYIIYFKISSEEIKEINQDKNKRMEMEFLCFTYYLMENQEKLRNINLIDAKKEYIKYQGNDLLNYAISERTNKIIATFDNFKSMSNKNFLEKFFELTTLDKKFGNERSTKNG